MDAVKNAHMILQEARKEAIRTGDIANAAMNAADAALRELIVAQKGHLKRQSVAHQGAA